MNDIGILNVSICLFHKPQYILHTYHDQNDQAIQIKLYYIMYNYSYEQINHNGDLNY